MAQAPGHRLGQIIGRTLEASIEPVLKGFAKDHGLYLDRPGHRPARRGKTVTWVDDRGNKHDLDFVLERGGTDEKMGTPAAFIETAWRRYTKHSKAKAQEIQGAIEPLLARFSEVRPFAGAVLAGAWTMSSLTQLTRANLRLLRIEYGEIVAAFAGAGIDVNFDASSSDAYLQRQVERFGRLTGLERDELSVALRSTAPDEYEQFFRELTSSVTRTVAEVRVLPLHGAELQFESTDDATAAIAGFGVFAGEVDFHRVEIAVRFSNGDRIEASFGDPADAVSFLRAFG